MYCTSRGNYLLSLKDEKRGDRVCACVKERCSGEV
jgi:hypothetical protein